MPVPANANALLTLEDLRGTAGEPGPLGIVGTSQDDMLQELINRASDWVEHYCGRGFLQMALVNERLPGKSGTQLRPWRTPIDPTQSITLTLDGAALTVWRSEADGDPASKDVIVQGDEPGVPTFFYRAAGWRGATPWPVLASYTGGFLVLPGELKEAAVQVVQTFHRHRRQLGDVSSLGAGPVSAPITYYQREHIPMAAMKVLEMYARWSFE